MNTTLSASLVDKPVFENAADSYTMPARLYTDPDVFEQEKEAIFAKSLHYIGHQSHVAKIGDYLTLDIADESVFVIGSDDIDLVSPGCGQPVRLIHDAKRPPRKHRLFRSSLWINGFSGF